MDKITYIRFACASFTRWKIGNSVVHTGHWPTIVMSVLAVSCAQLAHERGVARIENNLRENLKVTSIADGMCNQRSYGKISGVTIGNLALDSGVG